MTRCPLTIVVKCDPDSPQAADTIFRLRETAEAVGGQVVIVAERPWSEVPAGVTVVDFPSRGIGDLYDAAAAVAEGDLLAFVDRPVRITPSWAETVIEKFAADPELTVAGGPVVATGGTRSERLAAAVMHTCLGLTPTRHNFAASAARQVREVGSSNLVIRRSAFVAIGGFQSPAGAHEESIRLCYKVRALVGGRIVSDPALMLEAPSPSLKVLAGNVVLFGRSRGDIAHRIPVAAPLLPYALPSLMSIGVIAAVAGSLLAGVALTTVLLVLLASAAALFVFKAAPWPGRSGSVLERAVGGLILPFVIGLYGTSFIVGYLGRSREDVTPARDRPAGSRILIMNWRDVTHPHSGGAETYMHQIAKRWAAQGLDVGWVTQRHGRSRRSERIDGIRFHRIGGRVTQYPMVALAYLVSLRRRYDLIIDCENGVPFFSPFYSRKPKVLVVHHVHQEIFRAQVPKCLRWLAVGLEGWLMPLAYRRSSVVAVSEGTRDDLVELGFDAARISVIRNGVTPPKPVDVSRSERPSIMCMGRLARQKSVDHLIRAVPGLLERFPDLRVDILGQGPDRGRLERITWELHLAGHVRFHGYVAASVRDAISGQAWVAVCPSSFEGWGVVCMEASARGLPVIASDVAGLRESVRDGETGLLVPYGDIDRLTETLSELLSDEGRRQEMAHAGQAWAARHSWDASATTFRVLVERELGAPLLVLPDPSGVPSLASWV